MNRGLRGLPFILEKRYIPFKNPSLRTNQIQGASRSIGFSALASVSSTDTVYPLLGKPHESLDEDNDEYNVKFPKYLGATFDASVTNLTYHIPAPSDSKSDPAEITLSFFSPITPTSTLRQSLPVSYLTVYIEGSFDVDLYIDVNGRWVSGDENAQLRWDLKTNAEAKTAEEKGLKTWAIERSSQLHFSEINDRSEWGTLHFTAPSDVDHDAGPSGLLRRKFSRASRLYRSPLGDLKYGHWMEDKPVFAFSKSFKLSESRNKDSVLFTIGLVQKPIIQFASARGLTWMRPLWQSYFPSDESMLWWHYNDFKHANALAQNYTDQLATDSYKSGGESYRDITALSARQIMAATYFGGTPEDPILFLKEISSNGNSQTIDVIFPAFPFFTYTNPRWLAYMLEPLIEHMLSGQYPNDYAMHDLGTHFPNITGHPDGKDEYMPVEECGDILIMGLSLAHSLIYSDGEYTSSPWSALGETVEFATGHEGSTFPLHVSRAGEITGLDDSWGGATNDKGLRQAQSWIRNSYSLWKQWTGYLVEYTLEPHNQLSTDDFAGWLALHSNLALKGIVGIKAMAELAEIIGEDKDAKHYRNISEVYIKKWEGFAMSRDGTHIKLAYDWYGSWTTIYSLFADALLCFHPSSKYNLTSFPSSETPHLFAEQQQPLQPSSPPSTSRHTSNFIPDSIYTKQSKWYWAVHQRYGVPLDSRHLYTKSDWELEAAAVASPKVRNMIITEIARWLNETETDRPFTDLYETGGKGGWPGPRFKARPVIGAHFASLALERSCQGKNKRVFYEEMRWDDEEVGWEWAVESLRSDGGDMNGLGEWEGLEEIKVEL
ncbi:MAG: hypothetical protein M1820_010085 [Bogoriella megaspora]|nr:MAG: hypothetical protein M1820_010085 [Bogoriella megaspora]